MSLWASGPIRLGLCGSPISTSPSPALFRAAWVALDLEGSYELLEVSAAEFPTMLRALGAQGFVGVNVTTPHKVTAFELVDQQTPSARLTKSVNAVRFTSDGATVGTSTDLLGIAKPLLRQRRDWRGTHGLVVGAGGAARAAVAALSTLGLQVTLTARRPEAASECARLFPGTSVLPWGGGSATPFDLVVQATPISRLGAAPPIPWDHVRQEAILFEMVYRPVQTSMLEEGRRHGVTRRVYGYEMLVEQAAAAFNWWTGHAAPTTAMSEAAAVDLGLRDADYLELCERLLEVPDEVSRMFEAH